VCVCVCVCVCGGAQGSPPVSTQMHKKSKALRARERHKMVYELVVIRKAARAHGCVLCAYYMQVLPAAPRHTRRYQQRDVSQRRVVFYRSRLLFFIAVVCCFLSQSSTTTMRARACV